MTDPISESTRQRAWRDTKLAWSGWWFWALQLVVAAVFSIYAVTFYESDATPVRQAIIQASAVGVGAVLCALAVYAGFFIAVSPRTQRNEARVEVSRLTLDINAREASRLTREQLLACRRSLGDIIAEAGDQLAVVRTDDWVDKVFETFYEPIFEICRDSSQPYLDESHVGRFYAAQAIARDEARRDIGSVPEREAYVVTAVVRLLDKFIMEINDELKLLPR